MGSSSVAGQSSPGLLSWGLLMRDRLAAAGMGVQGTGVTYAGQALAVSDPRWTFSAGGVAQVSVRLGATIDNTSWAQFASDVAGQNVKIHYQHDGGSFTYSIDGGAAVAVTTNGSATNGVVTVTGLSNATHTVKVTGANATATKPDRHRGLQQHQRSQCERGRCWWVRDGQLGRVNILRQLDHGPSARARPDHRGDGRQ